MLGQTSFSRETDVRVLWNLNMETFDRRNTYMGSNFFLFAIFYGRTYEGCVTNTIEYLHFLRLMYRVLKSLGGSSSLCSNTSITNDIKVYKSNTTILLWNTGSSKRQHFSVLLP